MPDAITTTHYQAVQNLICTVICYDVVSENFLLNVAVSQCQNIEHESGDFFDSQCIIPVHIIDNAVIFCNILTRRDRRWDTSRLYFHRLLYC